MNDAVFEVFLAGFLPTIQAEMREGGKDDAEMTDRLMRAVRHAELLPGQYARLFRRVLGAVVSMDTRIEHLKRALEEARPERPTLDRREVH